MSSQTMSYWERLRMSWNTTSNWNKLLVLLTAVIAISNSCYTHYASKQFDIMSSQLNEIHLSGIDTHNLALATTEQAKIAKDALQHSQRTFEIDERPYLVFEGQHPVFVQGLAVNQNVSVNMSFRNIGRTPAVQHIQALHLVIYRVPKGTRRAQLNALRHFVDGRFKRMRGDCESTRKMLLDYPTGHGEDVAPGDNYFASTADTDVLLSSADLNELRTENNSQVMLFAFGVSTYADNFKNNYETDVCRFYFGSNPAVWHRCDAYNVIK